MLEIQNLTAGYGSTPILHDLSFQVHSGQLTALIGPNGCGKSTLLRALAGQIPPMQGTIALDGENLSRLSPAQRAQKIAYLPQSRSVPDMTVAQLVLHGRFPYLSYPRRYRQEDHAAARQAMAQMGIEHLADLPLSQLSGGTRQKCYIALALCQDSPVLLLDEPLSFLDLSHQLELMQLCRDLARLGKTVILVLHDLALALQWADRLILMEDGSLRQIGSAEDLMHSSLLQQVFGVQIQRWDTPMGPQFTFSRKEG